MKVTPKKKTTGMKKKKACNFYMLPKIQHLFNVVEKIYCGELFYNNEEKPRKEIDELLFWKLKNPQKKLETVKVLLKYYKSFSKRKEYANEEENKQRKEFLRYLRWTKTWCQNRIAKEKLKKKQKPLNATIVIKNNIYCLEIPELSNLILEIPSSALPDEDITKLEKGKKVQVLITQTTKGPYCQKILNL